MASESEQERRETLADIVAEMRTRSREVKEAFGGRPDGVENMLDIWADRIEAVAKRDAAIHAMTCEANERLREHLEIALEDNKKPVGNVAAMREALSDACYAMFDFLKTQSGGYEEMAIALDKAKAALSAPARNCDLYATATEALKAQDVAFNEDNFKNGECRLGCPGCDDGLIDCKILWLFAPAAERKGEGDGSK